MNTSRHRRRHARTTCLLAVLTLVAACGAQPEAEPARAEITTGNAVVFGETRYIHGTVTAIPPMYGQAALEIDGKQYGLADVWWADSFCGDLGSQDKNQRVLDVLAQMLPVGTPVVALLVEPMPVYEIFVHKAPGGGPTVNEVLLRTGWAEVNPAAADDYDRGWAELMTYHQASLEAQGASKADARAGWAQCEQEIEKQNQRYAQEAAEMQQRIAEWEQQNVTGGGGDVDIDVDWGDGYCTTCRVSRNVFGWLF